MSTHSRPSRIPRISLANLLMLTVFVALAAFLIRWGGWLSIAALYVFTPTIVGATCGLFEWPNKNTSMFVVRAAMIGVVGLSLVLPMSVLFVEGPAAGLITAIVVSFFTLILWMPQYMVVASNFD